ncbi:PREDICTED: putative F-box/FBD/LRR-repeat protein At4g26350 [Tarenaya hassleriana]|uniref:putative F-box/FBD/LRR-repeat protein At4g26350 n=1 Tax=Tarenaya hassleriana TaxID=28532 RepID=UPI00053C7CB8|nr:PREDICTED: putative F-box/FBD/LRR-repeat protein At4g26350 [Tarenaya hassleriana]
MDRISLLPDVLLIRILSFVPTKDVFGTMVLSRRWQSLWTMVPRLEYASSGHETERGAFTEFVYRSLLSNKAPILESPCLHVDSSSARGVDLRIWVGIAVERRVRELEICLHGYDYDYDDEEKGIRMPDSLYLWNSRDFDTSRWCSCGCSFSIMFPIPQNYASHRSVL